MSKEKNSPNSNPKTLKEDKFPVTEKHKYFFKNIEEISGLKEHMERFREIIISYSKFAAKKVYDLYNILEMIDLDQIEKGWLGIAERAGESGWTLPLKIAVTDLFDIMDLDSLEEIDQAFVLYYDKPDKFDSMKNQLLENEKLEDFRELLHQCFMNYENEQYLITIPSLFTILEGFAHKLIFTQYRESSYYNEKQRVSLANKFNAIRTQSKSGKLESAFYASAAIFLTHSFNSRDAFHDEEDKDIRPLIINRNRVLHGRDNPSLWNKADALRLFNAIHTLTILDLSEEI